MLDQLVDQRAAFRFGHAEDPARVRGEIQRLAPGFRDHANERLRHWRQRLPLLLGEIGKTEPAARVEDRVLGDEPFEPALHGLGQRVVGGALVGEFGVAADRRDGARIEQRCERRQPLERAVGVPDPVRQLELPCPRILPPDLVLVVEVGNVGEFFAYPQRRVLAQRREREVLLLRELLVRKDQHRVGRERRFDCREVRRIERPRQVEIADFSGKVFGDRVDADGHLVSSAALT